MTRILKSLGPAIIVAAVVLGPGSILTSSKVGANIGLIGIPFVLLSTVLMISMVALSARLGVACEGSLCDEIARRVGRWAAVFCGVVLFFIAAFFQYSNNLALVGGVESLSGLSFGLTETAAVLAGVNLLIIAVLYLVRHLYKSVETVMKLLVGLMMLAFLANFVVAFTAERKFVPVPPTESPDSLALLALMGTTFIVGAAFYQSYLVREKGWGIADAKKGLIDSVLSISLLGLATCMIVLTSWRVFYGNPEVTGLGSINEVAMQLEPAFGSGARIVFAVGILAGAMSSFLVNSMIGGTVLSDSLGLGSKLSARWPLHFTTLALLTGMTIAILTKADKESTVHLITLAQALAVIGGPVLAIAMLYLATRKDLKETDAIPRWMVALCIVGLFASLILSALTTRKIVDKFTPETPPSQTS